eukprot:scaffold91255_cov75-Attheya_sp.AAC.5
MPAMHQSNFKWPYASRMPLENGRHKNSTEIAQIALQLAPIAKLMILFQSVVESTKRQAQIIPASKQKRQKDSTERERHTFLRLHGLKKRTESLWKSILAR